MTVEELLKSPLMRHADVVTGTSGLGNEVTWCVPDTSLQLDNYIMPGLLLISTGEYNIWSDESYLALIENSLVAGIVVMGTTASEAIRKKTVTHLKHSNISLIQMPAETGVMTFMKRFVSIYSMRSSEEFRIEEWLRNLCFGIGIGGGDSTALQFGYSPSFDYYCLRLHPQHAHETPRIAREMEAKSVENFLSELFNNDRAHSLSFINNGDEIISFIPWPKGESAQTLRSKVASTITDGLKQLSQLRWKAAVGSRAYQLIDFQESYENAMRTAEVIESLGVHDRVNFYDDWYMHMLLLRESKEELGSHMRHTLQPILDAPDLLETLATFLVCGESLKLTSERMFIHVNTLKYRLRRIADLLGVDLKDPNVRFRLRMAITIERYLHH